MQTVSLSALRAIPVLDGRPFGTVELYSAVTTFRASTVQGVLLTTSIDSDNFTSSFIDGSFFFLLFFLRRIMADKCEGQSASAEKQKKKSSSSTSRLNLPASYSCY